MVNRYLLLIVILLGAGLRFYGINWGLPYTFHADEHLFVIRPALRLEYNIFCNHSLNPEFSSYGALPLYIFLFVKWIYLKALYLFDKRTDLIKPLTHGEFADYLKTFYSYEKISGKIYIPTLFIIGRSISAFLGTASIYLIFSLAKKLFNSSVGILSAIFFTLTVGLIQASHFFTVDNILIFFMLLTLIYGVDILKKGEFKYYIFAGLALGLALSVKLTSLILFLPIFVAHLLKNGTLISQQERKGNGKNPPISPFSKGGLDESPPLTKGGKGGLLKKIFSKKSIIFTMIAITLYFILNPYSILNFKEYWSSTDSITSLGNLLSFYHREPFDWNDWRFSYNGTIPYWYHIKNLLFFGMGLPLEIISLVGIFYSLKKMEKSDKFLLAFILPFFLIVGSWSVKTLRYILPLIPFIIILGSRFLLNLHSKKENIPIKIFSKIAIIVVIISAFIYSLSYANIYSLPDTRIQASDWIYKNVQRGSTILLDDQYHYTVPLGSNRGLVGVESSKKPIFTEKILWESTKDKDQEYIKNHIKERLKDVDYIVVSEWYYHSYSNPLAPKLAPAQYNFYKGLFSGNLGYRIVKVFNSSPKLFGKVFNDNRAELLFKVFDHPKIFIFRKSHFESVDDQPNILFLTVDTLRADHLKCYGYSKNTSPNIDRLARKGVIFKNTISQFPQTNPSFASIFTSVSPHDHGALNGIPLDKKFITLAEILKRQGYMTGAFISGYPLVAKVSGLNQGFDLYDDKLTKHLHKRLSSEYVERTADETTDLALKWLKNNKDKRFFLWLHYYDPHAPYKPQPPYNKLFVDKKKKATNIPFEKIEYYSRLDNISDVNYYISQYDGEIAFADMNIGNILKRLDELNLTKKTLILFISDHGESLTEHNTYFDHGSILYDEQIKVPFIISYPSFIPENKIIETQVRCIDVMPTILDFLGIPFLKEMRGTSLIPLIFGEHKFPPQEAFSEVLAPGVQLEKFSIRFKNLKFIFTPKTKVKEFYNLESDPGELVNIIDKKSLQAKVLEKKLFNWMGKYDTKPKKEVSDTIKEKLKSLGYFQ